MKTERMQVENANAPHATTTLQQQRQQQNLKLKQSAADVHTVMSRGERGEREVRPWG